MITSLDLINLLLRTLTNLKFLALTFKLISLKLCYPMHFKNLWNLNKIKTAVFVLMTDLINKCKLFQQCSRKCGSTTNFYLLLDFNKNFAILHLHFISNYYIFLPVKDVIFLFLHNSYYFVKMDIYKFVMPAGNAHTVVVV